MRIAVVSLYTPEIASWAKPVAEAKAKWCALHGYDFICHTNKLEQGKDVPASWSKLAAVHEICARGEYDWVFCSDADAVVMDYALQLEPLIEYACTALQVSQGMQPDLIIGQDDISVVNMGQFAVRGNQAGAALMECIWDHGLRRPDSKKIPNIDQWWEQAALVDLMQHFDYPRRWISVVDRNLPFGWNTFKDDAIGNRDVLMIHLAGMPRRDIWAPWLVMLAEKREAARKVCGFVPPTPGYAPCTREKGHDGPCAHELASIAADGEGRSTLILGMDPSAPGDIAASRGVAV